MLCGGIMRIVFSFGVLMAASIAALSQSTPPNPRTDSLYIGDEQLRDILKKAPGSFSTRLFADTTYSLAFIRLEKPDQPHAHGTWSEVFVVKEGSGVLETGGTITGVTGTNSATHQQMFVGADGKQVKTPPPG